MRSALTLDTETSPKSLCSLRNQRAHLHLLLPLLLLKILLEHLRPTITLSVPRCDHLCYRRRRVFRSLPLPAAVWQTLAEKVRVSAEEKWNGIAFASGFVNYTVSIGLVDIVGPAHEEVAEVYYIGSWDRLDL